MSWKIQHFRTTLGASERSVSLTLSSLTQRDGSTSGAAVSSTTKAFATITNIAKGTSGPVALTTSDKPGRDISAYVVMTGTNGVDVYLAAGGESVDYYVDWMVVECLESSGHANEFIVRDHQAVLLPASNQFPNVDITGTGISNIGDCVPFICGVTTNNSSTTLYRHATMDLNVSSTTNLAIIRGAPISDDTYLSYAIVEFVGSNWTIQNQLKSNWATAAENITISAVNDITEAFVVQQALHFSKENCDDWSAGSYLLNTTTLRTFWSTGNGDLAQARSRYYIIENPELTVYHENSYGDGGSTDSGSVSSELASGDTDVDYTLNTSLTDLSKAFPSANALCRDGGRTYPRGHWGYGLESTTAFNWRRGRVGSAATDWSLSIATFPSASGPPAPTIDGEGTESDDHAISLIFTPSAGATAHELYGQQSTPVSPGPGNLIDNSLGTAPAGFIHSGIASTQTWYYVLRGIDGGGSTDSSEFSATTAPERPTNLSVTPSGLDYLEVTWTDNTSPSEAHRVFRLKNGETDWEMVANVPAGTTPVRYRDYGAELDTTYTYDVRAYDVNGTSGRDSTAQGILLSSTSASALDISETVESSSVVIRPQGEADIGVSLDSSSSTVIFSATASDIGQGVDLATPEVSNVVIGVGTDIISAVESATSVLSSSDLNTSDIVDVIEQVSESLKVISSSEDGATSSESTTVNVLDNPSSASSDVVISSDVGAVGSVISQITVTDGSISSDSGAESSQVTSGSGDEILTTLLGTGNYSDGSVIVTPQSPFVVWHGRATRALPKRFLIRNSVLYELDGTTPARLVPTYVPDGVSGPVIYPSMAGYRAEIIQNGFTVRVVQWQIPYDASELGINWQTILVTNIGIPIFPQARYQEDAVKMYNTTAERISDQNNVIEGTMVYDLETGRYYGKTAAGYTLWPLV